MSTRACSRTHYTRIACTRVHRWSRRCVHQPCFPLRVGQPHQAGEVGPVHAHCHQSALLLLHAQEHAQVIVCGKEQPNLQDPTKVLAVESGPWPRERAEKVLDQVLSIVCAFCVCTTLVCARKRTRTHTHECTYTLQTHTHLHLNSRTHTHTTHLTQLLVGHRPRRRCRLIWVLRNLAAGDAQRAHGAGQALLRLLQLLLHRGQLRTLRRQKLVPAAAEWASGRVVMRGACVRRGRQAWSAMPCTCTTTSACPSMT